ncbi:hypothetical protein LRS13_01140 [Svornostia abyssi]|uniref:Uncharacterized protein n=1 Tax=Svornostia abyssi TaxID=2898438 RepID=A0ABY5PHL8_9ACTN|nr:hypothetical protein LRS13_01140 [Parviterribacteraceae bacterium J379]
MLGSAGSAQAAVDITALVAKPIAPTASCSTTTTAATQSQAGAHEDFCVALGMNGGGDGFGGGDDLKDLKLSLPGGQVGNATATPLCTVSRFRSVNGCASSSQVGQVTAGVESVIPLNENLIGGGIYNLEPRGTEAARLGLVLEFADLLAVTHIEVEIRLRPTDGGLDSLAFDNPRTVIGLPIEVKRLNLRLWGSKTGRGMAKSFMANPTDCSKPATTTVSITSYQGGSATRTAGYTPTGCDAVPFEPGMILEGDRTSDAPGVISTGVSMPANDEPLVQKHIATSVNVLPEGVELSPTSGSQPGFVGCTEAEFGYGSGAPATCAAGSKIGTVRFRTPLLSKAIEGDIFLAQPTASSPKIRLFVEGELGPEPDATRLKFIGVVRPDPDSGQLRTTFENLPPAPFTEFRLTFRGGPTAIMSLPRSCGTFAGQAINTPYGSTAQDRRNGTLTVDQGCADPDPFTPSLGVSTSTTQAASGTALTTTLARPDGHARLTGAKISLPAGLQGNLTVVPPCSVADGRAGSCGPASRVGAVVAIAGPGSSPATLRGDVYFTEPPTPGGLAGLSIVVPATFGPLDLGKIVVNAEVATRADTGLDITVTDIPQRAEGIATQVRSMDLVLDKPGFFVTPSSCDAKTATGTLFSDLGQAAAVSAGFQATGCENLPFSPKLATTIDGGATGAEAALNGHPGLNVTVTQAPGEANNATVDVTLPTGMAPDSDRLGRTCALKQYEAGTCPDSAKVGRVVAYTPLLPEPLQGGVTFVTVPGSPLPELRADLRGKINLTLNGKIKFGPDGRMVNSFVGIPDVPLSRFDFTLEGGARGLVIATKDLCSVSSLPFDGAFTSHAGGAAKTTAQPRLDGCAPQGTLKVGSLRSGRPTLDLRVVGGRTRVRSAQLVVPKGLAFAPASVVRKRLQVSTTGLKKGAKARVTVTGQSIRVTVPSGQSATVLRVRVRAGGLRASTRLRKQGRPRLTFRLNTTTADAKAQRRSLRVRPAAP